MNDEFAKILAEECGGDPSDYTVDDVISGEELLESRTDEIDMTEDNLPVSFEDLDLGSAERIN